MQYQGTSFDIKLTKVANRSKIMLHSAAIILVVFCLYRRATPLGHDGTNNITSFVPRPASFECSVKNDSRIFKLYKDGKLIVNASLLSNNGTTSPSKYELRGPSANRFKINRSRKTLTFVLKETASEDFGFYSCKGIIGNRTVMQLEKYQLTVIKNITSVVPKSSSFECSMRQESKIFKLYKDGNLIVTAVLNPSDSTISVDNDRFERSGTTKKLTLELKETKLGDEGYYSCNGIIGNGTVIQLEHYLLTIKALPTVKTNTSKVTIFEGDTANILCTVSGMPTPTIKWLFNNKIIRKTGLLSISKASDEESGIYKCLGENDLGNSSTSVIVEVLDAVPGKPLNFTWIEREEKSITLSWRPGYQGKSAITFYLLREVNKENETKVNGNKSRYTVIDLKPSTAYRFRLTACNAIGCGDAYASLDAETAEQGKPTKPSRLKAPAKEGRNITLTWIPGEHKTRPVTYSQIIYMGMGMSTKRSVNVTGNATKYTVKGLMPYTKYSFQVITCVENKKRTPLCSDPSGLIEEMTRIIAPSEPLSVQVRNTEDPEVVVRVTWLASEFSNGPSLKYQVNSYFKRITNDLYLEPSAYKLLWTVVKPLPGQCVSENAAVGIQVEYKLEEDWISVDVDRRSNPLTYDLKKLKPTTTYQIRVIAANSGGSTSSKVVSVTTDEAAPGIPTNLKLVKKTASSLTISWESPSSIVSPIHEYEVCFDNTVNRHPSCRERVSKPEETTIDKLMANTTYEVKVQAFVQRHRDNEDLGGKSVMKYFKTDVEKAEVVLTPGNGGSSAENTTLIVSTVVSLLVVVLVVVGALYYCRKKDLFGAPLKSTFYVQDDFRPLASRLSLRQSERKQPAIPVEEFAQHVEALHADSDYLFSEEFQSLGPSRPDFTWEHSTLHLNRPKNRYQDIVAYDHSRVRLMSIDGVPASNYINANFVDGFQKKNAYIATQAPLNHTFEDFWRMVYEQDVRVLIMLTNLLERGRRKCDQYWPNQGSQLYGNIKVRTLQQRRYAPYIIRVFSVCSTDLISRKESDGRIVRQFHYTDWPDFGVPRDRSSMLSFIQVSQKYTVNTTNPVVVHCSAGVGRSGTYIVLESQMERVDIKGSVSIYNFIKHIRQQRNYLVQQESQYVFIHDTLLDYIECGVTVIPVDDLEEILDEQYFTELGKIGLGKINDEWKIVNAFNIDEFQMLTGRRPVNQQKNRDTYIIPVDTYRVRLTMREATEGTDYINASYLDGFHEKKAFIATQMPLLDTMEDFWRMVWENVSQIIVSLLTDNELQKEDFLSYLPREDCNPINFGLFEIHCLSEKNEEHFRIKELEIVHRVDWGESEKRRVYHYQFLNWSEDDFPEPTHLFSMMDSIREQQNVLEIGKSRQENHPVVVHCSCGISRTGVYCCLSNITEQMKDEEQLVDVFTTVRVARSQRPLIIQTKSQYEYLYKATFELKKYLKGDSCDGENDKELPSNGLAIKAIDELDTVSTSPILEEDDSEA